MENRTPLVSFCIFTYNQERLIADAVKGALAQTYGNMEIIISDDNSSDNTWQVIQDVINQYQGEKNIVLNRNEHNLRLVPHVNHVILNIAKGDIIVLAAGDDISLPNRVEDTVNEFLANPKAMAVCGQAIDIDEYGNKMNSETPREYTKWHLEDEYIRLLSFMTGGAGLSIKK